MLILSCSIISCKLNTEFSSITKDNFYDKLEEAYTDVSVNHKYKLSDDVQLFVEINEFEIKGAIWLGKYNYLLCLKYYNLRQFGESRKYILNAIDFFEQTTNAQNELAFCYIELANIAYVGSDVSEFEQHATKVKELADEQSCPNCMIDLFFTSALFFIKQEEFEKSKTYSLKAIELIKKYNTKLHLAKYFYNYVARSDIKLKNYDAAKINLQNALDHCLETDYNVQKTVQNLYGDIYKDLKDFENAVASYERADEFDKKLYRAKLRLENDKMNTSLNLHTEIDTQKKRIINQQRILLALVIGVLAFSFAFVYWVSRQRNLLKRRADEITTLNLKLQNAIIDLEKSNQELKEKTEKIDSLLQINIKTLFSKELKLSTMRDTLISLTSQISGIMNLDLINPNQLVGIEKKILDLISDENQVWEDYKVQFEQIRPGFFKKINALFPDLTVNELKHCSYILSNLSNKDVATLVNVSPRSVETARYRIKKKLELKADDVLYDYLQKVV